MKYQNSFKIRDNPHKIFLRMNIVKSFLQGMTLTKISKELNCTIKTAKKWVDRYKCFIEKRKNQGNPIQNIDKEFNFNSKEKKRKISIPYNVQNYVLKKCANKSTGGKDGISLNFLISQINHSKSLRRRLKFTGKISKSSLHRFIHSKFGKTYKIRKKPLLKDDHKRSRKQFTEYIKEEEIKGEDIFFTDEKLFLLDFIPNKQTNQFRLSNCMKKKLRKGNESVEKILSIEMPKKSKGFMAAGGVSKYGPGKLIFCIGTVDSYAYKKALYYYLKDIEKLSPPGKSLYFQQDNAPAHSSKEIKKILLETENIKSLKFWPPNSPEISPIEKVWAFILRKLEGKKFNNLEDLKKEVLFIWNRIPISFCEKIIDKFNDDIHLLSKSGGIIKSKSHSSYKNYKLVAPLYSDNMENIIYNKNKMNFIMEKKKKTLEKLIAKKRKIVKKLETKAFSDHVYNEITKKYRTMFNHLIRPCLKEEIDDYKSEIESLEGEKINLRDTTAEDFFNNLKQKEKESMINLEADLNFANDLETNFSEINQESEEDPDMKDIIERINRPFKRMQSIFKKEIKKLIEIKVNSLDKTAKRKFKVIK